MTPTSTPLNFSASSDSLASSHYDYMVKNFRQEDVIFALMTHLRERESELRKMMQTSRSAIERQHVLEETGSQLQNSYDALLTHLSEREAELRSLNEQNEIMHKRQLELESIECKMISHVESQRRLLHEKEERILSIEHSFEIKEREMREDMKKTEDNLRSANKKILDCEAKLNLSSDTEKKLTEEIKKFKELKDAADVVMEKQVNNLEEKENQISRLLSRCSELGEENVELKSKLESQNTDALSAKVQELESEVKQAHNVADILRKENCSFAKQLEDLKNEKIHLTTELQMYTDTFPSKEFDIVTLHAEAVEARKMLERANEKEKEIKAKQCIVEAFRSENELLREELQKVTSEFNCLDEALKSTKFVKGSANASMLLSQLADGVKLKGRITTLEKKLETKECMVDLVQSMNDELRSKQNEKQIEMKIMNKKIDIFKKELQKHDVDEAALECKLQEELKRIESSQRNDLTDDMILFSSPRTKACSTECRDDHECLVDEELSLGTNITGIDDPYVNSTEDVMFDDFVQDVTVGIQSIQTEGFCIEGDLNICAEDPSDGNTLEESEIQTEGATLKCFHCIGASYK